MIVQLSFLRSEGQDDLSLSVCRIGVSVKVKACFSPGLGATDHDVKADVAVEPLTFVLNGDDAPLETGIIASLSGEVSEHLELVLKVFHQVCTRNSCEGSRQ